MRSLCLIIVMLAGCTGWISPPLAETSVETSAEPSASPLRRLTRAELAASLTQAFAISPAALVEGLPEDITAERGNPFDNDYALQDVATAYVQSLTEFAERYGDLVASQPARVDAIAGCRPTAADDAACLGAFVQRAGRLVLRRELAASDVALFLALIDEARAANDYYVGIAAVVQALVQHPETIFRFEIGEPARLGERDAFLLGDFEVASRLAFLVWGAAPDEALLDVAASGGLADPGVRRGEAQRLYDSPQARAHWRRFHAQWLGYADRLPDQLVADLTLETDTVVDAVTHDEPTLAWFDLFTLDRSYLTPALAAHYGMAPPATATWVRYSGGRGGGVLAHGMFLQQGAKFGDTSPTLRGYRILKRVLCGELGALPTSVDTDVPPAGTSPSDCKEERYTMRATPACATCHMVTDGIGFGLENFSATGAWREVETKNPACAIDGAGDVLGESYSGPAELGAIIAASEDALACGARQLFRFASGRTERDADEDGIAAIAELVGQRASFRQVLMTLIESPMFNYRTE